MDWQIILLLLVIGALSGFLAGLLGIGGGFILVPPLFYLFRQQEIPPDQLMHIVIATSLAVTAMTTLGSTYGHYRENAVNFIVLRNYVGGLFFGCISGAFIANLLPSVVLRMIFGCILFLIGLYFLFFNLPTVKCSLPLPLLNLFGFIIGNLSSLLGVGGGIFTVPVLIWNKLSMHKAVGTSSAATLVSVWVGSLTYLILAPPSPSNSALFGYIDLPAFATLSIAALLTVRFGVKAAHRAPVILLRRVFGIALLLISSMMLLTGRKKANLVPATGTFLFLDSSRGSFFDLKIDLGIVKPGG